MNRLSSYISGVFGARDISRYPVYYKTGFDMSYEVTLNGGIVTHEVPETPRSLDWKTI
jgi:hypothetical protein